MLKSARWLWVVLVVVLFLGAGAFLAASRTGVARRRVPEVVLSEARDALRGDELDRAERLLEEAGDVEGALHSSRVMLSAELERKRGRPEAALKLLSGVPNSDSQGANCRLFEGQIERARNQARLAEECFLKAIEIDPELVQARWELVYLYGKQARRGELSEQFRALAELGPLNHQDMLLWTVSHEDVWLNETIVEDLERFLTADPADRWSRIGLARVYQRQGRPAECLELLSVLPEGDIEARALRARAALDLSKLDEAEALVASGPEEHAGLSLVRGQLALRRSRPEQAIGPLRIAAKLEPTSREVLQGIALAAKLLGEDEEARRASEQAGRLRVVAELLSKARTGAGQEDATLPKRLAEACAATGQIDEAKGWYRLAIAGTRLTGSHSGRFLS